MLRPRRWIDGPNTRYWWLHFVANRYGNRKAEAAIWTIDTFHARRWDPERFEPISHTSEIKPGKVLVGIENECSSHFSACHPLGLSNAAAVVVSWSQHVLNLARDDRPRRERPEKKRVHAIETQLIIEAVDYLLL